MKKERGRIPFVPSPHDVVEKMLSLADPRSDELLIDLGSGDGRIVISAAENYRCSALGVEIDKDLVGKAKEKILRKSPINAQIVHGDLFNFDFSKADVVTLYLLPSTLEILKPKLLSLKKGARIVCHDFAIPGVKPSDVIFTKSWFTNKVHKIYVYEIS